MVPSERKSAAPAPAGGKAEDRAELGGVETRSFANCPGELRRTVERDAEGRVVRYVRLGERLEIDQRYGPDGRLVAAYQMAYTVTKTARALPLDYPGLVRNARDAGIDAPPRCEP